MAVDRYKVNDALTALASDVGVTLDDPTLNEVTHRVADVLDSKEVMLAEDNLIEAFLYLRKQTPKHGEKGYIPEREWLRAMRIARGIEKVTE